MIDPLRIALIGPFGLRVRGTLWRRALPLGQALARRGHAVTLIAPPWDSPQDSGRQWDADGVRVVNTSIHPTPAITAHLLRALQEAQPTLVHAFKPKGHAGLAVQALWLARQSGRWRGGLVIDADDWEGAGGWNDRAGYPLLARWLFAWQERWGFRHADALTVASRWLEAQAYAHGARRVLYLPNGIDAPAVPPTIAAQERRGPPTALLLTRFVEFKPAQLVEIWSRVVARLPAARLLVAGGALRDEARVAQHLLAAAGFDATVEWLNTIPPLELPALYARADVAFFPANANRINRAKSATRLADLLAAGVPVVASRIGEQEAYIVEGKTGLLTPPGDDRALGEALADLLADRARARRMGQAAQRHMAEQFTWTKLAGEVERLYEETLSAT